MSVSLRTKKVASPPIALWVPQLHHGSDIVPGMSYLVSKTADVDSSQVSSDGTDESMPSNSHASRYWRSALASTMKAVEAPVMYSYQCSQLSCMNSHIAGV